MRNYTAEQITAIGGQHWTKGGHDRVYLNANIWARLIGLEISYYGTGNISSATLDGESIANGRARDILGCIDKVYWDATDSQIHITIYRNRYSDRVPGWIRAGIAEAVDALDKTDDSNGNQSDATDTSAAPEQTNRPEPAAFIAALRTAGRTIAQIAALVGVSISTIYRWAHGTCQPLPTNAAALAALAI